MEGSRLQPSVERFTATNDSPAAKTVPGASISLVLPTHNAELCLARILRAADEALARVSQDYEILVVDAGSGDATLAVAKATAELFPAVRVVSTVRSLGFGDQVRVGIEAATKPFVAVAETNALLENQDFERLALLSPHCDLACGARTPSSGSRLRRVLARGYSLLADLLIDTNVRDCRAAVTMARRSTWLALAPQAKSPFLVAELLARATGGAHRRRGRPRRIVRVDPSPTLLPGRGVDDGD